MIQSMTGYGKAEVSKKGVSCSVELRSVNSKFLDSRIKLPKEFALLEDQLKAVLKEKLSRGKVDLHLSLEHETNKAEVLKLDPVVLENTIQLIHDLEEKTGRTVSSNFSDFLNIRGLVIYETTSEDTEFYQELFIDTIRQGVDELLQMRKREGELLCQEILTHAQTCQDLIQDVPSYSQEILENYRQRLQKNLESLEVKYGADDPRILQEIGIITDRCDVTEELERFQTHLTHLRELSQKEIPVGRKLDFLMQEMNREANTLCSKANHSKITAIGVNLKCEIEKMREQIQNIE